MNRKGRKARKEKQSEGLKQKIDGEERSAAVLATPSLCFSLCFRLSSCCSLRPLRPLRFPVGL